MIENLPLYVVLVFIITTLATLLVVLYAGKQVIQRQATWWLIGGGLALWSALQAFLALNGFYLDTASLPPRVPVFAILPALAGVLLLFVLPTRRAILTLPLRTLTWVHTVRIPVELVLWWLFLYGQVPRLMTFAGSNMDIVAGISAPLAVLWAFQGGKLKANLLLGWNVLGIALLLNVFIPAILSQPYPIQRLAFEQPNRAVVYFPFIWLPALIVPLILFCHVASIGQILAIKRQIQEAQAAAQAPTYA